MGKKILITATELHMLQFWLYHIENFIKLGYEVELVCSHVGDKLDDLKEKLKDIGNPRFTVVDLKRNPASPHNLHGYLQLRKYFKENSYDAVITNEPVMGVMTRLAARTVRKKNGTKVIYFAHGFHFWKGAPIQNWLLFYPVEKLGAHFTDVLVTMNKEDYALAKKRLQAGSIKYTYGIGADLSEFSYEAGIREAKRNALGVGEDEFMLFSAAELSKRKNLTLAFDAVKRLVDKGLKVKLFVRGKGPLEAELNRYISENGLKQNVFLLGYGKDIKEMCLAADAFIFTSKQEGLPVAVMEAMSCGLPCIVSDIRGVTDLVESGKGGYICRLNSPEDFALKIQLLAENKDTDLRYSLTKDNKRVLEPYSIEKVFEFIKSIVDEELR